MPGSLGKGPADYYALGDYNARCSICGAKEKASKMVRNWQGLYRHPANSKNGCNEPRQPQDFVRGVQDIQTPPWVQSDENGDIDIQICTFNGQSALPGYAIPGCMIPGRTQLLESEFSPPIPPPPLTPPPLPPPVAQIGSPALLLHLNAAMGLAPWSALLHMDGANGATSFVDSSVNNFTITNSGGVAQTTSNFEFGTASGSFNGSNTLRLPLVPGGPLDLQQDFTVQGWFNTPTFGGQQILWGTGIFATSRYVRGYYDAGTVTLQSSGLSAFGISGSVTINTWNHFAMTRRGGDWYVFLNGQGSHVFNVGAALGTLSPIFYVGGDDSGTNFPGLLDEVSVLKGIALWTANFTPPVAPFTAQASVVVPDYSDSSLSHYTATTNGQAIGEVGTAKFGTGALSVPGAASIATEVNALTVPIVLNSTLDILSGTANFTVEGWFFINPGTTSDCYPVNIGNSISSSSNGIVLHVATSTGTFIAQALWSGGGSAGLGSGASGVTAGVWHHFAIVRLAGVPHVYLDGVQIGAGSGTWNNFTGYPANPVVSLGGWAGVSTNNLANGILVDEVRITPKLALYTTNFTSPTAEGLIGLPNILGTATPPP
jgi:hypothetical protein